jgi:tetratricopeptide (TPR) repeat protein
MGILFNLSALALRQLVGGASEALGLIDGARAVDSVANFLGQRFLDQSQRLTAALQEANDRAWKAVEIALGGDSLWDRLKNVVSARAEDRAFSQQIRAFLDATPMPELANKTVFRQRCLKELRDARKAGVLTSDTLEPRQLATATAGFARFADPAGLLDVECRWMAGLGQGLEKGGYPALGWLLKQRPQQGAPLLVLGVRYFFRRAVERDPQLARGLAFSKMETLGRSQEEGFAALTEALGRQGQRLEELLADVKVVVVQTHDAVLDLQVQMKTLPAQVVQQVVEPILKALEQRQLQKRELRPSDSLSIRSDAERQFVKEVVARYRGLPEAERKRMPAVLNAVGKLEVVAGDFAAAQRDFQEVAKLVADPSARAQAHHNAYRAALERHDWSAALQELIAAIKLNPRGYAPFPVNKYYPQQILGAGGFGVAFLCQHRQLNAPVVVKTLASDELDRSVDEVFTEAQVLYQLDHPAIIRLLDCGYTFSNEKARPYLVMSYFESITLEDHIAKNGPLSPDDLVPVARAVAAGLHAAHSKNILHRDVKPANLLLRKDDTGWQVKVIDFGLAIRHDAERSTVNTGAHHKTLVGSTIAGTLDYGAPEQMGRLPGVAVGRYSDVYSFAKTCCYALFKTAQPLPKHFQRLPPGLADLLEECLEEAPEKRPANFSAVLKRLATAGSQPGPPPGVQWFFMKGAQRSGPVTEGALRGLLSSGQLKGTDLVWKNGMRAWVTAATVREFGGTATAGAPTPPAVVLPPAQGVARPPEGTSPGPGQGDRASPTAALLRRGDAYNRSGKYEQAITAFTEALRLDPRLALAHALRGDAYGGLGKYDEGIADCSEAIRYDPKLPRAYAYRGWLRINKGDTAGALADCDEAVRLGPKEAEVYRVRGVVSAAKGDEDRAFVDFAQAIKLDPNFALAYLDRAQVWAGQEKYDLAILDLNEATRLDPTSAEAFWERGEAFRLKGDYRQSIPDYSEAIRLGAQQAAAYKARADSYSRIGEYDKAIADLAVALRFNPQDARAYVSRGVAHKGKKDRPNAVADYAEAIRLDPAEAFDGLTEARGFDPKDADTHYYRGRVNAVLGKYGWAVTDYTKAIQLEPKYAAAYAGRGWVKFWRDEYDEAIADFSQAICLDPGLAEAYCGRAWVYCYREDHKDYNRAFGDATEAIRFDAKSVDAYLVRGIVRRERGEFPQAVADFTEVIRLDPQSAAGFHQKGLVYSKVGQWDTALAHYSEAIKRQPDAAESHYERGRAQAAKGQDEQAIADYAKAIQLDRKHASAYYQRALAHQRKGDRGKAEKDFTKAAQLDPALVKR